MRIAVTGAAGFIGRAVVARIIAGALGPDPELRLNDLAMPDLAGTIAIHGSFADPAVRERLLDGGVDLLFHLASLPGGAAEADFPTGRTVNLDATLALLDLVAAVSPKPPVVVYASSIAVLDMGARHGIGPATPLCPSTSYGTHKAMVELYVADLSRRSAIDGRSVRPAGIVARPRNAYAGFATAWMSDLFRAAADGRDIALPWPAHAHVWLQSIAAVADAIIHAATLAPEGLPPSRAWTLPATVARLDTLGTAVLHRSGSTSRVTFGTDGDGQPPLDAADALAAGFRGDGDVEALVANVFAQLG